MGITREFTVEQRGLSLPDYAAPKPVGAFPVGPVYTSTDVAELAARLSSICTFDRRGNVIWLDDFEGTLGKWGIETEGAGYSAALSAEAARSGAFSAKLISPDDEEDKIGLKRWFPLPVESNIGFEFSWARAYQLAYIHLYLYFVEAAKSYSFRLRYHIAQNYLQYYDGDGDYISLEPRAYSGKETHIFNTIKLVVDYANKKYVRALFNSQAFDLSDLKPKIGAGGTPYTLRTYIYAETGTTPNVPTYIDDVILTQNEPANP